MQEIQTRPEINFFDQRATFVVKLAIFAILTTSLGISIAALHPPFKLLPQLLLGMMFAHAVELQHELTHHIIFANERLNRLVGIVLGLPMLVSFSLYKALHGHHHRALGTPEDQESFSYSYEKLTSLTGFISHLSMFSHYVAALANIRSAILNQLRKDVPPKVACRVRNEFRFLGGLILLLLISSALGHTLVVWDIWLVPLILSAGPVHALIELPEHLGCDQQTTDSFRNTRSIRASKLVTWYVNGNNYHVEHHVNAALPINQLANFHTQLAPKIEHVEPSYWAFYRKFFQQFFR
ncbi:fatty acid desaturase [Trichocoleus sp. FACHB-262]|uniref:fatty acid desaturase n=1 Tax=Trichocoleus sp. FACHB-262 TaxID=2692869 RepID=UPI0016839DAC|nr:fatty acid desaturase [Trichocoleus sp. FACHB-262]MBD2120402.1 fatty acid desaturase [Trichocoleus sp. FACHB-262]